MKIRILGVGNGDCNILDDIQKDKYYADATFVFCDDNADDGQLRPSRHKLRKHAANSQRWF